MSPPVTGVRYGPDAWLLTFGSRVDGATYQRGMALRERLAGAALDGLAELVPGFTTLLCRFDRGHAPQAADWWYPFTQDLSESTRRSQPPRVVEVPVRYDGEDLAVVAAQAECSIREVIRRHRDTEYFVHCLGFAPGFPYLGGLDPELHTPRRLQPRPRVPAGSVAIGGEHTGIYSIPSPGGWNLIGRTPRPLFVPSAQGEDAFLLRAGDAVRFVETDEVPLTGEPGPRREVGGEVVLTVVQAGSGVQVQDPGRPGRAAWGVPVGGAMVPTAAAGANRLLDNPPEAPVLELLLGRQEFRAERATVVALSGAPLGAEWLGAGEVGSGVALDSGRTVRLEAGDRLRFRGAASGVWAYLAVPGGVAATQWLGSCATSSRAGLGTVLQAGDLIRQRPGSGFAFPPATVIRRLPWGELWRPQASLELAVWPGPQAQAFPATTRRQWWEAEWRVSTQSDRTGYRLEGPALEGPPHGMISEPVLPGSIQVPPSGQPLVTLADGPTMGGYPKLGWLAPTEVERLVQASAGTRIRFRPAPGTGWD